jgi:GDP-4-dehydro-6-deoxy-D-mannose reductase
MNKTVLITGSEGFVGRHLKSELEKNQYQIFGCDINNCDITKLTQISDLISKIKPDYIVHLAGQPKPGLSFQIPQKTFEINTIGTINLLESIRSIANYFPKILLVGTSEEHGIVSSANPEITEDTPLNPINPYAISKVANWYLAQEYVRSFNFDIVYATPFTHTGPGQMPGFISTDVANQIISIERGLKEPIISTGDLSSKRDICDVRDVVRAYRLLLEKGVSGQRYIISTGKSISIKSVVDKLISLSTIPITQATDPLYIRPTDIPNLFGSHKKITNLTGWQPQIPLNQTLKDLLDWYRQKL